MPAGDRDTVVYVITLTQQSLNHRAQGMLKLGERFSRMTLVTKTGSCNDDDHIIAGAYPNPFGILNLFGLQKIKKVLDRYSYFPSPLVLYCSAAKQQLKRKIQVDIAARKNVVVITVVPPHEISMIGLCLKKEFPNIHWITDWQDLWTHDEYYFARYPNMYKKRVFVLEKEILALCDMNITTNTRAKAFLENHYKVPSSRVCSITHHFCPLEGERAYEGQTKVHDHGNEGKINVGFLGNLFKPPKVPGDRVVEAFKRLNEAGLHAALQVFGDSSQTARRFAGSVHQDVFRLHPKTSHEESVMKLSCCDYVLLVLSDLPNCQLIMHQKLPYYLMMKKPIIAIVPQPSAVADIIQETGSGYTIDTRGDWVEGLASILRDGMRGESRLQRNEAAIQKYSWKNISVEWMNAIIGAGDNK